MTSMTQNQVLLDHFLQGGTLTVLEAIEKFGVYALSQRVGELKKVHPIDRDMVSLPSGKRVARYYYRVPFSFLGDGGTCKNCGRPIPEESGFCSPGCREEYNDEPPLCRS